MSAPPTLLIDASIYIFQYYFSLPDHWYSEAEGWPTAAVYGYTAFLVRLLQEQQPQRIGACFDKSLESCFRNEIYADYKSSRALPDQALAFQLEACQQVTALLGIQTYASDRYEADDLLGSLYRRSMRSTRPIAVLTRDKDLGQVLVREQDFLWDYLSKQLVKPLVKPLSGAVQGQRYYRQDIYHKFGVWPQQLPDYLALVGDSSDDIPGVPGLGPKTAGQLLAAYGTIASLWEHLDQLASLPIRGARSLGDKLILYREQIAMAQQLATIVHDLPLIERVSELQWQVPQWQCLEDFCRSMGFPRLFRRIQSLADSGQETL